MKPCLRRPLACGLVLSVSVIVAAAMLAATPAASTFTQNSAATPAAAGGNAVPGEAIVKFRPNVGRADVARIAREVGADDGVRPVGGAGHHVLRSRHLKTSDLIAVLSRRGDVAYAEPNYIVRALDVPNDPRFPQVWGLQNLGQAINGGLPGTAGADIHAVSAWDISTGSRATSVAVIDTGIDYTHPDLASNVWSAPTDFSVTIGGMPLHCAAGTHGFNAITRTCDPMDDHGHGSHVSGTIGAAGNNGLGVAGVNWTASIMGAKFLGTDGSGTIADAIDAIEFVIQANAAFGQTGGPNVRVLSNSWGDTDFSQALLDEIERANDHDLLFVAAAGNSGFPNDLFPTYPAGFDAPNIVAVAATDNNDAMAWFSNYGATTVHLGAPGVDILSTIPGNSYAYYSGTSMAAPHVSGAAVLILSICPENTAQLKGQILNGVDPVDGLAGVTITGGRLNVNNVIRACSAVPAMPTGLAAAVADSRVTLTWSPVAGASGYNVKRSLTPGGPYTTIASATAAAYTDTSVTNDVTYYYVVSAVNSIGEGADSVEVAAMPQIPPDLAVSALSAPAAAAGATIVVTDTTKNQGAGVAGPSTTRFYLSTNSVFESNDTLLDGSRAVPLLAPGASSSGSTSVTIPAGVAARSYFLIARADADGVVSESSETNNIAVRVLPVGPDLIVSALQVPSTIAPGSSVSVSGTTANPGGGAAGASVMRFYLSTNTLLDSADTLLDGSLAVPALAAGASSSGSTTVTFPANLGVGSYYLIAKADADAAVAETNESNNSSGRGFQSGPDLAVSAVSAPSSAGAGATILVSDTTKNQGASAAGPSTTRFYLSTNSTFDSTDTLLDGSRAVASLAAGASSSGSTSVTIPAGVASASYYLIARADADEVIAETSETNNTASRVLPVGPDLVMSVLQVPSAIGAGSAVSLGDTTTNQGAGGAGPSTTRFYLSTNSTLDSTDTLLDGSRAVPALAAGASSSGSTMVTFPADLTTGSYYVIAKADADGSVAEGNESNNTVARGFQSGSDLVVSALSAPTTAGAGTTIVLTDTTKNQGASATGSSTTRFYLSVNSTLDSTDTPLDGSRAVPSLAGGASSSGSTSVTIPSTVPSASYYLIAKADADGVVPETSETNNFYVRTLAVGPDLGVSLLQVPSTIGAGSSVSLTDTTVNQGAGGAGASTTRFYLSTNATLDSTDTLLDGSRAVPALAAGASSSGPTTVTIPADLAAGRYYVIAKADAEAAVAETNEANNTAARGVQAGPDLTVSALGTPSSGGAGATIVVTDTTRNQGAGVAGPSTTRFYLSTNSTFDSADTLLDGSRAVPSLAGGASSSGSTSITIPAGIPTGTYYLIAKADADGVVQESSEANNVLVRALPIVSAEPPPVAAGQPPPMAVSEMR